MAATLTGWQIPYFRQVCVVCRIQLHSRAVANAIEPIFTKLHAGGVLGVGLSIDIIHPETGSPDTTKVDQSVVHKLAARGMPKQRTLVSRVFFWGEEPLRWRLLGGEQRDWSESLR